MLGSGVQFGRSRGGEDRFYTPAKACSSRRGFLNQDHLRRALSDVTASQTKFEIKKPVVLPPAPEPIASSLCNLEQFLQSIIPSVPAQFFSKTTMRGWTASDGECQQSYFVLGDLWESFKEWSAYGAGVPLVLNDTDSVVQYYVPYLSGIQLYGNPSKSPVRLRRLGEDSDGDFRDSSTDGSSDEGEAPLRMNRLSLRDQHSARQEGFSSDEGEFGSSQVSLLFEYLEWDPPFGREPLTDKISDLALRFPELKSLRSCDLHSTSWISVAWYPIYRIPVGPTLKDLDACFLTFHPLHTPVIGNQSAAPAPVVTYPHDMDGVPNISLPVFGLASFKFRLSLWTDNGQLVSSLLQAADNWMKSLQVNHPDFRFFCRR